MMIATRPIARCMALAALVGTVLTATSLAESPQAPRGAELLKPFKQQLMGALKAGLQEGPDQAIAACKTKAPQIAAGLSVDGVEMGRTSHKLRNPDNVAPAWVAPVLQSYLSDAAAAHPVEVDLGQGRKGYVEPIRMQASPCLMCHGETLAPAVAEQIEALYPEDQATGFSEGDLRGVFWVSYPEG
jgi:hypothetical protein